VNTVLPLARRVARHGDWTGSFETVSLAYDARLLRRRKLTTDNGRVVHVNLAETVSVNAGDAFCLDDGTYVAVRAAAEDLLEITGADLHRIAWHIGNRHTPCQIAADRLLIQRDHVLRDMLIGLGADIAEVTQPFSPEGGAYGQGRTFSHHHADAKDADHISHHHSDHQSDAP